MQYGLKTQQDYFTCGKWQANSKIYIKMQWTAKIILKNKVRRFILQDRKTVSCSNIVSYWYKDRQRD